MPKSFRKKQNLDPEGRIDAEASGRSEIFENFQVVCDQNNRLENSEDEIEDIHKRLRSLVNVIPSLDNHGILGGGSALDLIKSGLLEECHIAVILREILKRARISSLRRKVHRDIKAANVLLSEHVINCEEADRFCWNSSWMAPEVIKQASYDFKADIWSLDIHPMRVLFLIPTNPPPELCETNSKRVTSSPFIRRAKRNNILIDLGVTLSKKTIAKVSQAEVNGLIRQSRTAAINVSMNEVIHTKNQMLESRNISLIHLKSSSGSAINSSIVPNQVCDQYQKKPEHRICQNQQNSSSFLANNAASGNQYKQQRQECQVNAVSSPINDRVNRVSKVPRGSLQYLQSVALELKRAEMTSPGLCDHLVAELLITLSYPQVNNGEIRSAIGRLTSTERWVNKRSLRFWLFIIALLMLNYEIGMELCLHCRINDVELLYLQLLLSALGLVNRFQWFNYSLVPHPDIFH
uniref:Protein kinase domain-containing protein n=1 Tax=Ditylenchus dipsaci TaxID=166011 RepID=A0A915DIH3_9BILA